MPDTPRPALRLLAGALALAGLGLPAVAQATAPGANGAIAFVRDGDIWAVQPDGDGLRPLMTDPAPEAGPAWSHDGARLAFTRITEGRSEVWVTTADGAPPARVATTTTQDIAPAWTPDGRVIFSRQIEQPFGPPRYDLYTADPAGGEAIPFGASGFGAEWAADGSAVITAPGGDCGPLRIATPAGVSDRFGGTDATGCPDIDRSPTWSPDGSRVAWMRVRYEDEQTKDIAVSTLTGAPRRLVLLTDDGDALGDTSPSWSPDGRRLVYEDGDQIHVVDVDGGAEPRPVTSSAAGAREPAWQPLPGESPTPVTPGGSAVLPVGGSTPGPVPAAPPLPSGTVMPTSDAPPSVLRSVLRPSLRRLVVPRTIRLGAPVRIVARFDRLPEGTRIELQRRRAGRFGPLAASRVRRGVARIAFRPQAAGRLILRLAFRDAGGPRVTRSFAVRVRPR